jgi:predicted NBD/HSP70 family sugar kinase
MLLTGKPQLNRFVNRRLILDKIRRVGTVSRAALAKQTAIRPPTVSAIVKELIEEGLVEEVGLGATSGGRAPRMVALAKNQPKALGFELTETSILAALYDLTGNVCAQCIVPFTPEEPDRVVDRLEKIGADLLGQANIEWDKLEGVGVAIPGYMANIEGHIRWSRAFGWRDVPFKQLCEERWKVTTDVVNDALAGGMAAQQFSTEESTCNLVFLFVRFDDKDHNEVGLGAGIIIDGEPYRGEFGAAGEIRTPMASPLVHARDLGLLEEGDGIKPLIKALKESHPLAKQAIDRLGEDLSPLVLQIVNLLEPGVLMVDSDEPELRDILLDYLQKTLEQHKLAFEPGQTQLIASNLGEYALTRGAIVPTLQRMFRIPQWV